jgi:hypothetical protein
MVLIGTGDYLVKCGRKCKSGFEQCNMAYKPHEGVIKNLQQINSQKNYKKLYL